MYKVNFPDGIDLKKIYDSGQCFRWFPFDDGYIILAMGHALFVRQDGENTISLDCTGEEYENIWTGYFDRNTDYSAIRRSVRADDEFLVRAAANGDGLRILRQDPWEMIITFIISQRKNIPAIRSCVEKLCKAAGDEIPTENLSPSLRKKDKKFYDFPSPDQILSISCRKLSGSDKVCIFKEKGLESCSLGYRMPYLPAAAEYVKEKNSISALSDMPDEKLLESLMEIKGVGIKVANCAALFGFHRMNAFPVDVWMKRALERYPAEFDFEKMYRPYAGVIQQYMFVEIRRESRDNTVKSV
jgi:N-glycosylase/DNA lyase